MKKEKKPYYQDKSEKICIGHRSDLYTECIKNFKKNSVSIRTPTRHIVTYEHTKDAQHQGKAN